MTAACNALGISLTSDLWTRRPPRAGSFGVQRALLINARKVQDGDESCQLIMVQLEILHLRQVRK